MKLEFVSQFTACLIISQGLSAARELPSVRLLKILLWVWAFSLRSICRPPASPHPVRYWINVWLWETCRWQMFTFIMHDFHVAVNFSEPAKSRKWFCTLCLFNEIVTLMEVRLSKMEMTVSICHFYNFSPHSYYSHHHIHSVFMDQCKGPWSLKTICLPTVASACCHLFKLWNVYWRRHTYL